MSMTFWGCAIIATIFISKHEKHLIDIVGSLVFLAMSGIALLADFDVI